MKPSTTLLFSSARVGRRSLCSLAFGVITAIVIAGFAQVAHSHKHEGEQLNDTDVHCQLCTFAGGTAPPPVVTIVPEAPALQQECPPLLNYPCPESDFVASYEARGPPAA